VEETAGLALFAAEVAKGEETDLGRAAALLGLIVEPEIDVEGCIGSLRELARTVEARRMGPVESVSSLFGENGFRGNDDDYYDPRNSFLHEVLARRLGIPISLSVVAIEVGRHAGIPVEGVPFPGHFLVRVRATGETVILDPFAGGQVLSDADLLTRMRAVTGRMGSLGPSELRRASKRQVLSRMLQNLKGIYLKSEQLAQGAAVQERLVVLNPDDAAEVRDRGLIYARLGRVAEAEADLLDYMRQRPGASDESAVRRVAEHLRKRRGPIN